MSRVQNGCGSDTIARAAMRPQGQPGCVSDVVAETRREPAAKHLLVGRVGLEPTTKGL